MGMRTYIRIDTESYTGCFAFGGSQFVNDFQFGYGLYVEAENIIIQTQINFPVCLAYTSIDYFVCRESGLNGCADFSATYTVGSQTAFADNCQDFVVSIGLHGVMHAEIIVFACFFIDA